MSSDWVSVGDEHKIKRWPQNIMRSLGWSVENQIDLRSTSYKGVSNLFENTFLMKTYNG